MRELSGSLFFTDGDGTVRTYSYDSWFVQRLRQDAAPPPRIPMHVPTTGSASSRSEAQMYPCFLPSGTRLLASADYPPESNCITFRATFFPRKSLHTGNMKKTRQHEQAVSILVLLFYYFVHFYICSALLPGTWYIFCVQKLSRAAVFYSSFFFRLFGRGELAH